MVNDHTLLEYLSSLNHTLSFNTIFTHRCHSI
nr:unnamed protein product [Callosobruchus chinensis]